MVERRSGKMTGRRWPIAMSIVVGIAGATWPKAERPLFIWNATASVPVGLYVIAARPPARDELAVLRLDEPIRGLADARGYLPSHAMLIKPVAARAADTVCRIGTVVTINGQLAAHALSADMSGRNLPQWRGCQAIDDRHLFVLSPDQNSFDGRYFGLVEARHVIGMAVAVWTVG